MTDDPNCDDDDDADDANCDDDANFHYYYNDHLLCINATMSIHARAKRTQIEVFEKNAFHADDH